MVAASRNYLKRYDQQKSDIAVLLKVIDYPAGSILAEHFAPVSEIQKSRYARYYQNEQYQLEYRKYPFILIGSPVTGHNVIKPFLYSASRLFMTPNLECQ